VDAGRKAVYPQLVVSEPTFYASKRKYAGVGKKRKRTASLARVIVPAPGTPNQRWSMDFMSDGSMDALFPS
jgi:hypothetical protein